MKIFTAFAFCFLLFGCVAATAATRIPNGIYREPSNSELIDVREDGLIFSIRVPKLDPEKVLTRGPYRFEILPSGIIHIEASSNDSVYIFGIGRFVWSWDGKNIVRKDVKTGGVVTFAPGAKA